MRAADWLTSLRRGWVRVTQRSHAAAAGCRRSVWRVEPLEPRVVLALDFGDAPDTGAGTGAGNFQTTTADNGPRHTIVTGLRLGATVDGEANGAQTELANGDDIVTSPDDEDGVVNPQADLLLTTGTQPTITLRATNTRGAAATLSGWIDYNNNGVFDNASERAQINVPDATTNGLFTLTFPVVPTGFTGTTYARFRLSTDAAASNPTGAATSGEVEDYVVTITVPNGGTVKTGGASKLSSGGTNMPPLADLDYFGSAVANLGDLDGDGFADLAVGAVGDDTGGTDRGAVHILFLDDSGAVISSSKIGSGIGGGPALANSDGFGTSTANLGDLDGDGVTDLAVGALRDDTGGVDRGAVHILFLNANGTVKSSTKIASGTNGGPTLANEVQFGASVANLGDLDGDGVTDLAVGAYKDDTGGLNTGAVHILLLNANGTVKSSTKIASGTGGGPTLVHDSVFGSSLANLGDLDGDGVADLAVGAYRDSGTLYSGAVYILFLNGSGTAKSSTKIASGTGGGPTLDGFVRFGRSLANVGDQDGDGVDDLAVGATRDDTGGTDRGALYTLFLNRNGTAKGSTKIASGTGGGPTLASSGRFGASAANLGDLDGDGMADLAVGAYHDTGGNNRGLVHVLRMGPNSALNVAPTALSLSPRTVAGNAPIGAAIGNFTTTDPNFGNTFTYTFVAGSGSSDNGSFAIVGNQLRSNTLFNVLVKSSYTIRVRTTDQGGLWFEQSFTITVTAANDAPNLDNSGNVFAVLGVGARQSTEMRQGTLVSDLLARGAGGNPISDPNAGTLRGIAITAVDESLGSFQFTLVSNNPLETDWINVALAGVVADSSALLLPTTARLRFVTGRIPHHVSGSQFLALESKLDAGITFRAWDQTTGSAGGRADASVNGGTTAFSSAVEMSKVYFEARLFRHYNANAQLNVYTLEAEFNALAALNNPAFEDRSTDAWTGFTVLLSSVPELVTAPLYRMYYAVQYNANGTETDMGYRYLTTSLSEVVALESSGPADKRPLRAGAYFRELGVNSGTGILGYIYTTQQPGTQQMRQIYRTDIVQKPTRPPGTREGATPTSFTPQENGDHVYTTNTAFETTKPGTWRIESSRGFVRPLGGSGIIAPATPTNAASLPVALSAMSFQADVFATTPLSAAPVVTIVPQFSTPLTTSLAVLPIIRDGNVSTTLDVGLIAPPVAPQPVPADDTPDDRGETATPPVPRAGDPDSDTTAIDDLFGPFGSIPGDLCPW